MSTYHLPDDVAARLTAGVGPEEAAAVLYHYDTVVDLPEPGTFVKALVALIAKADQHNRARLGFAFPAHVAAVQLIEGHPDGLARLRAIAGVVTNRPTDEEIVADWERANSGCCPRCGWHLSSHGHSHGPNSDCPGGGPGSPSARDGSLAAMQAARARQKARD